MAREQDGETATNLAASAASFSHLPRDLQWRLAKQCQQRHLSSPLVAVSTQTRDLLIEYASKVEVVVNSDHESDNNIKSAACFLRRVCQEGKDGLKLQISGKPENIRGKELRTLLHPSFSTGGWIMFIICS
jgi:hypothetical protein